MRVLIQHRSRYSYPAPALLGPHVVRLRPSDHTRARIESYTLSVEPRSGPSSPAPAGSLRSGPEHRVHWQRDPHGNHVARVTFKAGQQVEALELVVSMAVEINPVNPFDFFIDDRVKQLPFTYPDRQDTELGPYLDTGDPAYRTGRKASELLASLPWSGDTMDVLVKLNATVREKIAYVIRDEAGVWTPEETLTNGRGSCRDAAVLLVALMRARGIAARFVSGYLVQLADEGMIPNEAKGVARDVVDLHAWAEAFIPGAGWIGFDGTSGLLCGEGHIPLSSVASPAHAAPLDGTSDIAANAVEFATTITRLGHEARPTAPYTDDVWAELLAEGVRVDERLTGAGLAVWIGGEPTFTSREKQALEEWQGGALGADKWERGRALAATLRDRLSPGGVVLYRMGKHYPGESLPRWALDIVGRRDGAPLWPARSLFERGTIEAAQQVGEAIATALGISTPLHAAFEDPWEVLRTEQQLPVDVDPRTSGLDDPEERRRLAAILDRGVGSPVGFVLPLGRDASGWLTESWKFRRGHLFLIPGDSPLGLRLPLASLGPGMTPALWSDAPKLPDPRIEAPDAKQGARATGMGVTKAAAALRIEAGIGVRTALAVQPRDGQIWVFLPPLPRFEDFCTLIAALDTARETSGIAIHLEGYGPPPSPERIRFAVTPDPGVLEVNLPPVTSCAEAAALHATVFDAALATGLTAERYLLDGRLAGSGGGNHITIGGPTPEQSPWFARPDLLASLITFIQHHPSLSFMMTGLFVGPTSQAPRIDEARHDALYELEIALAALATPQPAWRIDALLRHLLVDVSGSTHRAEVCIDKLFDPLTPFGRQGLVELRAFEMPPHPRMLAAQAILVRSLLAAFVERPYRHDFVRWGQTLHDKYLLPYWMWRDFEDVLAYLGTASVTLPADGFRPFVELRCPLVGTLEVGDARLEVRNAIEPWHVLGEEATATGTARYVDSSLERIELRSVGLDPERYAAVVNGFVVPLREAGGRDVRVGGVRFRAWCPPHALQPHLGIHHPLRIDVLDRWSPRAVAGGAYHVWHPEGRAFDAPPLTRVEAAARRARRFTLEGPSPEHPFVPRETAAHPEQLYTLDLRRFDPGSPMPTTEDWA